MARRKSKNVFKDPFVRTPEMVTADGKKVENGDIIKIKGEWGTKFKFQCLVFNPVNNRYWIDCIEVEKGQFTRFRSFYPDRVKALPKKRKKKV